LEALVAAHKRRDVDRAFREGFQRRPESDDEMQEAERLAIDSIRDEEWDKWW
jgi:hypothetical protein